MNNPGITHNAKQEIIETVNKNSKSENYLLLSVFYLKDIQFVIIFVNISKLQFAPTVGHDNSFEVYDFKPL